MVKPLLFGQRFNNDGPNVRCLQIAHRLMVHATSSKPRLAKWNDSARLEETAASPITCCNCRETSQLSFRAKQGCFISIYSGRSGGHLEGADELGAPQSEPRSEKVDALEDMPLALASLTAHYCAGGACKLDGVDKNPSCRQRITKNRRKRSRRPLPR